MSKKLFKLDSVEKAIETDPTYGMALPTRHVLSLLNQVQSH